MVKNTRVIASPVRLRVKVVPGSSQSQVSGWLDDALKVRVSSPPENGAANKAVLELLSAILGLPNGSIRIVAGRK